MYFDLPSDLPSKTIHDPEEPMRPRIEATAIEKGVKATAIDENRSAKGRWEQGECSGSSQANIVPAAMEARREPGCFKAWLQAPGVVNVICWS